MSIASTKSENRNKTPRSERANSTLSKRSVPGGERVLPKAPGNTLMTERVWQIASLSILIVAAFFRLYDLGLVPLHHDEGVNGSFLLRLVRESFYHYDPANYHGPTLYYFALVSTALLGLNTFAIRFVPVLFGLGTIWLILCLRRRLGDLGSLSAGAVIAVSPGAVYLSRYFIHESLFVFFTVGIVYAGIRYYEKSNPAYLILATSCCALLFATKETAMISAGVLLIALAATIVFDRISGFRELSGGKFGNSQRDVGSFSSWQAVLGRFGSTSHLATLALAAIAVFIILNVLFYSSFFTNWPGVPDSLKTFNIWTRTGRKEHVHEWWTYLWWLWQEEAPILLLGGAGCVLAFFRRDNRFAFSSALWSVGICAAYSLVPYKTPWLVLNFIVPLAIMSGYTINTVFNLAGKGELALVLSLGLALSALGIGAYQMSSLNFIHYDDDSYPYVYAHTRRELLPMVNKIEDLSKRVPGKSEDMGVTIVSPDYWPLPWYFRDFKNVGYYGRITATTEPVIIGSEVQESELSRAYGDRYQRIDSGLNSKGTYSLRPGVDLVLYIRRDVAPFLH